MWGIGKREREREREARKFLDPKAKEFHTADDMERKEIPPC